MISKKEKYDNLKVEKRKSAGVRETEETNDGIVGVTD